VYAAV